MKLSDEQHERLLQLHEQHVIFLIAFNVTYILSHYTPDGPNGLYMIFAVLLGISLAIFEYAVLMILFVSIYKKDIWYDE